MTSTVLDPRANTARAIARALGPSAKTADVIELAHSRFGLELTTLEAWAATEAERSGR